MFYVYLGNELLLSYVYYVKFALKMLFSVVYLLFNMFRKGGTYVKRFLSPVVNFFFKYTIVY